MDFKNAKELLELCRQQGCPISEVMRRREWVQGETTQEAVNRRMERVLEIMRQSATIPLERPVGSMGGSSAGRPSVSPPTPPQTGASAARCSSGR